MEYLNSKNCNELLFLQVRFKELSNSIYNNSLGSANLVFGEDKTSFIQKFFNGIEENC